MGTNADLLDRDPCDNRVTITNTLAGGRISNNVCLFLDLVGTPLAVSAVVLFYRPENGDFFDSPGRTLLVAPLFLVWVQGLISRIRTILRGEFDGRLTVQTFLTGRRRSVGEVRAVQVIREDTVSRFRRVSSLSVVFHALGGARYSIQNVSEDAAVQWLGRVCRRYGVEYELVERGYNLCAVNWRRVLLYVAAFSVLLLNVGK